MFMFASGGQRFPVRHLPRRGDLVTSLSQIWRAATKVQNGPIAKALKGRKLYAYESGLLDGYMLLTASGGGVKSVSYEEALKHDLRDFHNIDAIRQVAKAERTARKVRTAAEREAAYCGANKERWRPRWETTTPGPFGEEESVERLVRWVEDYGLSNAIHRNADVADGRQGYGRPNERAERGSYAFAGLVAVWRGTWPAEQWPARLRDRMPARPEPDLMAVAERAAAVLAQKILTPDSELRLMWKHSPDGGEGLDKTVAALQQALS